MADWNDWLRTAVALGVMPEAFWRLSWREWQALTATPGGLGLRRGDLTALMAKFPDNEK